MNAPHPLPLLLALALAPLAAVAADAAKKPNIIVILADDLGWGELGCYGQDKIRTPNLDRIAAEGQRWTQFYSGAAVCSPSRCVLLTGRHTGGCNVQDLKRADPKEKGYTPGADGDWDLRGDWPMRADHPLPLALKKAGYATAAFGKWGMGEYGTPGAPDRNGVDHFYGYTDHRMCHTFYPPFLMNDGNKERLNTPPIPGHARIAAGKPVEYGPLTGERHASVAIRDAMLAQVDRLAAGNQPFFLYYCPLEPHVAIQPPKAWVDQYPTEWDPVPYRGERGYAPHPRPRAAYAATISFMDDNVGRLMAKLKEKGLDENTLVIFTSDNGTTHDAGGVDHRFFNSVKHLKGLKGSNYEGGVRVPTLVRWPARVRAGVTVAQPGYAADLMPTLCAIAGAHPGAPLGDNLAPVILGEQPALPARRPMVWTGGGYDGQASVVFPDNMKAVRRQLFPGKAGKTAPLDWEVYDLAQDSGETTDLAATRRDVVARALAVLKAEYTVAPGYARLAVDAPETGNKGPKPKATR